MTRTCAPERSGLAEWAFHSSPWTKTLPLGARSVQATPSSPMIPWEPVMTLLRRARQAIDMRNAVISPKGRLTASELSSLTRISGIGPSTRSTPPRVEANNASNGENAVGDELRLQREENEGQRDQRERGIAGGQQVERKEREEDEDRLRRRRG